MKVGFLIQEISCASGKGDGVRNQAFTWAEGLRKRGVDVHMVGPWDMKNFYDYDIVHLFGYYPALERDLSYLKGKFKAKIGLSPIIDTNRSPLITKMASFLHAPKLHMYSPLGSLRRSVNYLDGWFVRSEYEKCYIKKAIDVPNDRLFKVMLSTRLPGYNETNIKREDFCLLVSYLPSARKNIWRLIDAAIKYKFRLVLAGTKTNPEQYERLLSRVKGYDNIEVLGYQTDEGLIDLYRRARVFALPSLLEGVGLVALEAAANGCDIVLSEWGGPKEYYNGMAKLVNPLSVDEIGRAVRDFMDGETFQPSLAEYIQSHHSEKNTIDSLYEAYQKMLLRR